MTGRDELAARTFPSAWAAVANVQGKVAGRKRHNLRRRAEWVQKAQELRTQGHSCADCSSFAKHPFTRGQHICEHGSDFHGYQLARAEDLCVDWSQKP